MATTPFRRRLKPSPSTGRSGRQRQKPMSRQVGTVGYFQEQLKESDPEAVAKDAKRHVRRVLPANSFHYVRIRLEDAPPAHRTEVPTRVKINYTLHNPPGSWGDLRHSILRCEVMCEERDAYGNGFFSHVGEELIYTPHRGLLYGFFSPQSPDTDTPEPVPPHQLFRIRSQFPHHNYHRPDAVRRDPPICWMILRSASGTMRTSAYVIDPDAPEVEETPRKKARGHKDDEDDEGARFITREELKDPSAYAMRAWGIAENIRRHRQRAGLTINQLAEQAGMNASYISRLERGIANIGIDTLRHLADFLGLDLTRIPDAIARNAVIGTSKPPESHWLHDYRHDLKTHQQLTIEPTQYCVIGDDKTEHAVGPINGDSSSWIVVSGEVLFQLEVDGEKTMKEIVGADGVLHLKPLHDGQRALIEAREPTVLLEIRHSACCTCKRRIHRLRNDLKESP